MTSYSMTAPQLAEKLGYTANAVMFGETIRMIFWVIGLIVGGAVISKIGIKKTVILAMASLLIPQFLFPYIKNYGLLLVLKAIQGFASMSWPAFVVATMGWVRGKQIGLASGIFLGGSLAGGGIGGFIVGHVIPSMGWQASFWVLGLISVVVVIIWYLTVEIAPAAPAPKESAVEKEVSEVSPFSKMLRMPETWLLSLIMLGSTWMLFGLLSTLPIYGSYLGYDVTHVGNLMTAVSIGYIVAALIGGSVSDMIAKKMGNQLKGRAMTMVIGFAVAIIGAILLPVLAPVSFGAFYFAALLGAFGNSWPQAVFWAVPSVAYTPDVEAAGTGFTGGVGNISDPIAPLVIGVVLGSAGLWSMGWWTCAIASAVALIASIFLAARGKPDAA
ncbi:MAG TPA: MFS transporter [Anaerolineae bacterium]|nr:MFS transporter [Anaerolineae bacterium]